MPANHVSVVLVHGAWADGSSWRKVFGPLLLLHGYPSASHMFRT